MSLSLTVLAPDSSSTQAISSERPRYFDDIMTLCFSKRYVLSTGLLRFSSSYGHCVFYPAVFYAGLIIYLVGCDFL